MSAADREAGITAAKQARVELYDTLGQLRERLDYAKRFDNAMDRAGRRIAREKRENPIGFTAGVVAVASVAGLAVWGVVRLIARGVE